MLFRFWSLVLLVVLATRVEARSEQGQLHPCGKTRCAEKVPLPAGAMEKIAAQKTELKEMQGRLMDTRIKQVKAKIDSLAHEAFAPSLDFDMGDLKKRLEAEEAVGLPETPLTDLVRPSLLGVHSMIEKGEEEEEPEDAAPAEAEPEDAAAAPAEDDSSGDSASPPSEEEAADDEEGEKFILSPGGQEVHIIAPHDGSKATVTGNQTPREVEGSGGSSDGSSDGSSGESGAGGNSTDATEPAAPADDPLTPCDESCSANQ